MIDLHCHCLPAVDDGPADYHQSLALCRALVSDGITVVVATPHQLGMFDGICNAEGIRTGVAALNERLVAEGIDLKVLPGSEIRVDERIVGMLTRGELLTVADGGSYVLLELLPDVLVDISFLIEELSALGLTVIIAHPERYRYVSKMGPMLDRWFDLGIHLQITASSLVGLAGRVAERYAWRFVDSGLASIVATDSHDLSGRRPTMTFAFEAIAGRIDKKTAETLCIENPNKIITGNKITVNSARKHYR